MEQLKKSEDCEMVEISKDEYIQLLKLKLSKQPEERRKKENIRDEFNVLPIECIWNITEGIPEFIYNSRMRLDTWKSFIALARQIHPSGVEFYMDISHRRPYIRNNTGKTPRINELTEEQKQMSIKMLSELIPIYNRYFMEANKNVKYYPNGLGGDYELIDVMPELRE